MEKRAKLAAALARGDVPFNSKSDVMHVGEPKIILTKRAGHLTQAGHAWVQMGGVDPVRYSGELIEDGDKKYVMDKGSRVDLLSLHQTPDGPVWRPPRRAGCASGSTTSGRS